MEINQSTIAKKIKSITQKLLLSKLGWLSIVLANVFWTMFWFPFLVIGFITGDVNYYGIALGIFLFFAQPLIPMWIIIPLTAWMILKWLDHRQTI